MVGSLIHPPLSTARWLSLCAPSRSRCMTVRTGRILSCVRAGLVRSRAPVRLTIGQDTPIGVKRTVSTCRRPEVADCAGLGVMVTDAARRGAPQCQWGRRLLGTGDEKARLSFTGAARRKAVVAEPPVKLVAGRYCGHGSPNGCALNEESSLTVPPLAQQSRIFSTRTPGSFGPARCPLGLAHTDPHTQALWSTCTACTLDRFTY